MTFYLINLTFFSSNCEFMQFGPFYQNCLIQTWNYDLFFSELKYKLCSDFFLRIVWYKQNVVRKKLKIYFFFFFAQSKVPNAP